jgi:hypothetical protein
MSISSCPRCTQQVTLPVGVSTSAQVRCPLCRAQYSLADALVNMPPLLEVIGDPGQEPSDEWFDMPLDSRSNPASAAPEASTEGILDADATADLLAPTQQEADAASSDDLLFEAAEIEHDDVEHDDIVMQQQDTEIDELAFSDSLATDPPANVAPLDLAGPAEDDVLDFGGPMAGDLNEQDAPAAVSRAGAEPADEMAIDFGNALPAAESSDEVDLDFDAPAAADGGGDMQIDFGAPEASASAVDEAAIDFGQSIEAPGGEEEIGLDFGDPVVAVEPAKDAIPAAAPANDKKSRKKKEKKQREPKSPTDATRKRSPVTTGLVALLSGLFVIFGALYGTLWISPDYDFFHIGPTLASWGLAPSSFNKKQIARESSLNFPRAGKPTDPVVIPSPEPQDTPSGDSPDASPAPTDEAATTPAGEANENEPQTGATSEPAEPASQPPASEPVAETGESKKQASPDESQDTSLDSLVADDADKPKNMPVEAAKPVDDAAKRETPAKGEPDAAKKPDDSAADAPALPPAEAPSLPSEPLGPRDARVYTPDELNQAVQDFSQAGEKMKAAETTDDKTDLKKFRANSYVSMYRLAEAVAFANQDAQAAGADSPRKKAEQLVLEFVADPLRLKELKSYGAKWLVYAKRTTPGIVLAGTVQSAEQIGKLHQIKVQLAADAPIVTLVSKINPGVEANDEVLALGSIVERPEDQLAGYEGSEPAVVWSGLTLKLPAEK